VNGGCELGHHYVRVKEIVNTRTVSATEVIYTTAWFHIDYPPATSYHTTHQPARSEWAMDFMQSG
jgi:hypothetical protein